MIFRKYAIARNVEEYGTLYQNSLGCDHFPPDFEARLRYPVLILKSDRHYSSEDSTSFIILESDSIKELIK